MVEIGYGHIGYAENPLVGQAIKRPVLPLAYSSIKYGDAFIARVGVKNTSTITGSFQIWILLKDNVGTYRYYAYSGRTSNFNPGESREIVISKVAPDAYLIRIPAYAKADWEGINPVKAEVWNSSKLVEKEFNAFYATPDYFSIGILQHCFCEGIDSNGYPINPKSSFKSSERLYYYVSSYYDNRGMRFTFTNHISGYLPWTGYWDAPPNQNWYAVYSYFWYDPPLPTGTWEVFTRVAGNDVIKDTATVT